MDTGQSSMELIFHKQQNSFRLALKVILISTLLLLASCATQKPIRDGAPKDNIDISKIKEPTPRKLTKSKYGNPRSYVVHGRRYFVLNSARGYNKRGIASWYGTKFQGHLTSTRERYDLYSMTAASPVLPIPSYVRVTNLGNGKSIIVKVNDRGPFATNRILDLSYVAAKKLGYADRGTAYVQVTAVDGSPSHYAEHYAKHSSQHKKLYLQMGAFHSYANAKQLQNRVAHYTHRHTIITAKHSGAHEIYRVQIGPLAGLRERHHLQVELADRGLGHAVSITN